MKYLARWWALLACLAFLAGCSHLNPTPADVGSYWSGRLALQIHAANPQSFSASFELKGSEQQGELTLFNPLGGTVAKLAWQPGSATLHANGEVRPFDSLDALTEQAVGAPLPLAVLFDWLKGIPTPLPGWDADLSRIHEGRLSALRSLPLPTATLRVVLDK